MKKNYISPTCYVHTCKLSTTFLQGSDGRPEYKKPDNPYWKDEQPRPEDWWKHHHHRNDFWNSESDN